MPQRYDAHLRLGREHGLDVESLRVGSCRHRCADVEVVAKDQGLDASAIGGESCLVPPELLPSVTGEMQNEAARAEKSGTPGSAHREPQRAARRGAVEREDDIAGSKGGGGADGRYCTRVPSRYQESKSLRPILYS